MIGKMIRQHIIKKIKEDNLIVNADIEQCVSPASYELRVGSYYDWQTNQAINLVHGEAIAVAPDGFLLIGTAEQVNLPLDIIGMMYLRSTYARRGFVPWFQGIVDPGYMGDLTIVLHNLTGELVPVYGGERICHLVMEFLEEEVDQGYEGAYQGSSGATPPTQAPTVRIVGQQSSEVGKSTGQGIPKALLNELLSNPELVRRLLY